MRKHFSERVAGLESTAEMWFSEQGRPLRWHHPIGLLFDLTRAAAGPGLPWQLDVHFTDFPSDQLLPCQTRDQVESVFMSSLKEADQLKHGGKVVSQMQKKDHSQLWLGLASDKFDQFWAINRFVQIHVWHSHDLNYDCQEADGATCGRGDVQTHPCAVLPGGDGQRGERAAGDHFSVVDVMTEL